MNGEQLVMGAAVAAAAGAAVVGDEKLRAIGRYHAVGRDAAGNVRWEDEFDNLVTDAGAKDLLDKYLAGSAYTAATYLGLKGTGSAAVGDTQASGAGSRSKASSGTMTFTFTSGGTVDGAFLNVGGSATQDNTTGILFSAGTFSGGSKTVARDRK